MTLTLDLPEELRYYVEAQAASHHRSVADEVVALLAFITDADRKKGEEAWARVQLRRQQMLAERGGKLFADSTPAIRHSREHDH